ncbi:MAG: hypothetical protein RJA70_4727 [Pseudomonadota bacterium]|jgi:hypothetical protein
MSDRRIEHTFDCGVERFWAEVFFDRAFNEALFLGRLKFERWEEVERTETSDGFIRVVEAIPRVGDVPGPIKALLKNGAGYRERGEFRRSASRYSLSVTSLSLPDKLVVTGDMSVEPRGEGRCHRLYLAHVQAKLFGIGGLLEKLVLDNIEKSYTKSATFTESWLRDRDQRGT